MKIYETTDIQFCIVLKSLGKIRYQNWNKYLFWKIAKDEMNIGSANNICFSRSYQLHVKSLRAVLAVML